jgi:hypothetical protein
MPDQEGLFIQRIACEGEEVDLSFLQSCVLVETLDLSGPKLIMTLSDTDSILRDSMGIAQFGELEVTFADYWNDSSDMELKDFFVVLTMPVKGELVTLNCIQRDVQRLKIPATKARIFKKKPAVTIIQALSPGVACSTAGFPVAEDYHLLPGERPSVMLRQMAIEQGARIYYQRGKFFMSRVADMFARKADLTYAYENRQAEHQIIHYTRPNSSYVVEDSLLKSYCGWNMIEGFVWAQKHQSRAAEFTSRDTVGALRNLSVSSLPEVDFTTHGSGMLKPGISLDLEWNLFRNDAPIDESLPDKVVIGTAAHFYGGQKYFTRIKGALPL